MNHRKVRSRSQSALPQRKWSSSVSKSQAPPPHHGLVTTAQQEQVIRTRVHFTATPAGGGQNTARSAMPIDTTAATTQTERPRTALPRPLSGNVFLRNSTKHGWVAKAYPRGAPTSGSQPNLDTDFFTESCESLDSFFDDEFEEQEKLGNLLNCNTLGVETKPMKQDWVSGEIDIPRFHCPRCRDHWYGISSEPCDEELARLIREGLWRTGKEGKQSNTSHKMKQFAPKLSKNEGRDYSGAGGPQGHHPTVRHGSFTLQKGGSANNSSWAMHRRDSKKKNKKRITFQLDGEENGSQKGSLSSLLGGEGDLEGGVASRGRRGVAGGLGGLGGGEGGGMGGGGLVGGGKEGMGGSSEGGVSGGVEGGGEEDADGGRRGRRGGARGGGGGAGGDGGEDGGEGEGDVGGGGGRGRRGNKKTSSFKVGEKGDQLVGDNTENDGKLVHGGTGGKNSHGDGQRGTAHGQLSGEGEGGNGWRSEADGKGSGVGPGSGTGGTELDSEGQDGWTVGDGSANNQRGSLLKERRARNAGSGIQLGGGDGGGAPSDLPTPTDHGKRIRKTAGHMRAPPDDPASSQWGDPLHARSFLSSTATSRVGSTSNLHQDDTSHGGDPDSTGGPGTGFLPPIVHPIQRPPSLYNMDFMGPALTRPWTFSYH